jgi:hypothetical protein
MHRYFVTYTSKFSYKEHKEIKGYTMWSETHRAHKEIFILPGQNKNLPVIRNSETKES